MVKCWILFQEAPIGWALLTIYDRSMGVLGGIFQPLPAYETIRPIIHETTEQQRDQPPMVAQTETGERLNPVAGVRIEEFPDGPEIVVTVVGLHWEVIHRYFGARSASDG